MIGAPATEEVGHATAWKAPGEDLGTRRMQAAEAILDPRRVRRRSEQGRQHGTHRVADRYGPVGVANPYVHVHAERVVAPCDVLEPLLHAPVVRRVDDSLLLPRAPGMRPGRSQRHAFPAGELEQPVAALLLARRSHRRSRSLVPSGSRSPRRSALPRRIRPVPRPARRLPPVRSNTFTSDRVSGSSSANSSSSPTVKSVDASNVCQALSRSIACPLRAAARSTLGQIEVERV